MLVAFAVAAPPSLPLPPVPTPCGPFAPLCVTVSARIRGAKARLARAAATDMATNKRLRSEGASARAKGRRCIWKSPRTDCQNWIRNSRPHAAAESMCEADTAAPNATERKRGGANCKPNLKKSVMARPTSMAFGFGEARASRAHGRAEGADGKARIARGSLACRPGLKGAANSDFCTWRSTYSRFGDLTAAKRYWRSLLMRAARSGPSNRSAFSGH